MKQVLGLALAALLVGSCAPQKKPQEVVFWQFWPLDVIQPLVTAFEAENPGIRVRVEQLTWDGGKDKITAAVAAGAPPDLCELGSTYMPRFLQSGALSDWSAGVADLRAGLRGWEQCMVGDAIYGLPWVLGTRALFYNKTLFAKAGLDSSRGPETWAELQNAAARIQKLRGNVHGYGVSLNDKQKLFKKFMPYAWGNGGEILSAGLDSARFDSPENVAALEFYLGLRAVGTLGMQDALDQEFKEGRLGLQISGAWLFKQIPKEAPGLRYGVALVPRPAVDRGTHASFAGGEVLVSFQTSKRKEDALKLARFLVRPDNALALAMAAQSVQPATVAADTAAYYRERPMQQVLIQQFTTARFTPNHPAWDEMEQAIEAEVEQALYDKKSAAEAVRDANARIALLLGKK
ncbi:MAG: extracellular solute-binding protein [Candidatus Eisenbacteria bacterium]